jgi:uncharacterized membrane protein YdbT with pleckstrin-like domain
MDLHPGESVIYAGHPSARSIMSLYAKGAILGALVGAIFWFASSHGLGVAIFLGIVVATFLFGMVQRFFVRYSITNQRLYLQRGIISRNVQQTRIDRVQNVTTRQSVMDRMFRVGSVDFDTAGTDDSNFVFAGVNDPQGVVAAVAEAQRASAAQQPAGTPPPDGL